MKKAVLESERSVNDLVDISNPESVLGEIRHLVSLVTNEFDHDLFGLIHRDVTRLYAGEYEGYRGCTTRYHDLTHTHAVVLTVARLIHGAHVKNHWIAPDTIFKGLVAALFHDTGFIQKEGDTEGTGAKYTAEHEQRSINCMNLLLSNLDVPHTMIYASTNFINCTNPNIDVDKIPFSTSQTEMLGKMVGTADMISQMSDRNYLEKLLFLFREFKEAGIPHYDSELDLLQKTEAFYDTTVKPRLEKDFDNVIAYMAPHFKARWGVDSDLNTEYILKNLKYLKEVLQETEKSGGGYRESLKRGDIIDNLIALEREESQKQS